MFINKGNSIKILLNGGDPMPGKIQAITKHGDIEYCSKCSLDGCCEKHLEVKRLNETQSDFYALAQWVKENLNW